MFLFKTDEDQTGTKKCGGCNWQTTYYYGMGDTLEHAKSHYEGMNDEEENGLGLCYECIIHLLMDSGYQIFQPKQIVVVQQS